MRRTSSLRIATTLVTRWSAAEDAPELVSFAQAVERARAEAPELAVARAEEPIAHAAIGAARAYPNPAVAVGTITRTARLTTDVTAPLAEVPASTLGLDRRGVM